jgi:hypothetical protein
LQLEINFFYGGDFMPDKWTGELLGRMHNERVNAADIAAELGCTKAYVSMVFNGSRTPPNAEERFENAFQAILARRAVPDSAAD